MSKRWSKEKRETGLRAIVQGARGFRYMEAGEELASVAPLTLGRWEVVGWFFCCQGYNSYAKGVTFTTAEEAKMAAVAFYKGAKEGC